MTSMTLCAEPASTPQWDAFCRVNAERRAVRDFDSTAPADADIRAVLAQAMLAPSSGNLQAYQLHWIRDPGKKALVAAACNGQRAAASAPALVVVAASMSIAAQTIDATGAFLEHAPLSDGSKAYHRKQLRTFRTFSRVGPSCIWDPLKWLVTVIWPALTLLPFGAAGSRHWAARSAVYAAQTLLLAASARGLDACPMEGFSATKVARILGLPRGTVIPIVIALGRRAPDARIEPRWRRDFDAAVVVH